MTILVAITCSGAIQAFAVREDDTQASDGYEATEYRLSNEAINEWEDRVLIAATGKLENEGRVYYAYGDYVNELISYFTKDGLELTEKDAKDAIAQITDPSNAKAGAMSGYLYQIGGKPKDSDSLVDNGEYDGKVYPEFDADIRFADEKEYRASDLYKNNKAYIEERTNTVYESQSAMRKEMKELAKANRTYQKIIATRPADATITKITATKGAGIAFIMATAFLLLLTAAISVYGWSKGTLSIFLGPDDERWNRNTTRKERHRIRKVSAIILAVIIALDLAVICSGLTYFRTLGANSFIEDSMDKGGICQHGYMQFRDAVHDYLSDNRLPQNSLDRTLTYRDYRFDYVKGIRSAMKTGSGEVAYRGVQEKVEVQVDLLAYVTKKDSSKVVEGINNIYADSLSAETGVFIHDLRDSLKGPFTAGFIMSIISMLLAALMMAFERHNIYKGVRDVAVSALAGTVIWGVVTIVVALICRAGVPGIADDHVYVMLTAATDSIVPIMLGLLGIIAVASGALFASSWVMHRNS